MYYGISITHEDEHFVCKNTELILDDNLKSSNCLIPPFFVKKTSNSYIIMLYMYMLLKMIFLWNALKKSSSKHMNNK
jgi:hypothetical protein